MSKLARINRSLDIEKLHLKKKPDTGVVPMLDAVYIPTLLGRKNILKSLQILECHVKQIVLLYQGPVPEWLKLNDYPSTIIINEFTEVGVLCSQHCLSSENPAKEYLEQYDIPLKRNFALNHAQKNKFDIIGLIDDDILFEDSHLLKARYFVSRDVDIVGFHVLDYPDVSTIDHIERLITGKISRVSIGGNFLFFKRNRVKGFFPYVYNEDWFFILTNKILGQRVSSCGIIRQLSHKPWKNHERLLSEIFGEILITGVKKKVSAGNNFLKPDPEFWDFIYHDYLIYLHQLYLSTRKRKWKMLLYKAIKECHKFEATDLNSFIENFIQDLNDNTCT